MRGRVSPILRPIGLLRPVEVRLARGSDSHGRPAVGGRLDSHGLSLWPLTKSCDLSESLRWEAVGGRAQPLTTKSCDLCGRPNSASHAHRARESNPRAI